MFFFCVFLFRSLLRYNAQNGWSPLFGVESSLVQSEDLNFCPILIGPFFVPDLPYGLRGVPTVPRMRRGIFPSIRF